MNSPRDTDHRANSPIILVGMHRAGTTLVTRLLKDVGLYTGRNLDSNEEPWLVIAINNWMLRKSTSRWDSPLGFNRVFDHEEIVEPIADHVDAIFRSIIGRMFFFGRRRFVKDDGGPKLAIPWGFKDPRNSITLPVWHRLYPNCRVVVISRHGVDVARSLVTRENYGYRLAAHMRVAQKLKYRLRFTLGRLGGLSTAARMDTAFNLWAEYMGQIERSLAHCGNDVPVHRVCYEELLQEPERVVEDLVKFCELDVDKSTIQRVISQINETRRFSFKNYPESVAFAKDNKDVLLSFGYDENGIAASGHSEPVLSGLSEDETVEAEIKPRVSVIAAVTSDSASGFAKSLQALTLQSYSNLEVLVVAQSSSTLVSEAITRYEASGGQVKAIRADASMTHTQSINEGIRSSTGEFVAFLEPGSVWHPEKIQTQVSALHTQSRKEKIAVVYCPVILRDGNSGSQLTESASPLRGDVFSRLLERNLIPFADASLCRGEAVRALDGLDDALTQHSIGSSSSGYYWLWLQLAAESQFLYIDQPLVVVDNAGRYAVNEIADLSILNQMVKEKFSPAEERIRRLGDTRSTLALSFANDSKLRLNQRLANLGSLLREEPFFWCRGHTYSCLREFYRTRVAEGKTDLPDWFKETERGRNAQ